MESTIAELLHDPLLREARSRLEAQDEQVLTWQAAVSSIAAPSGHERRRGEFVAELFGDMGLEVQIDHVGNVCGWFGERNGKAVVIAAHLDTVFGHEVDVQVRRRGDRLEGPGVSDNARGLAGLLGLAETFCATQLPVSRPIAFVATVGEEGSGDLRGVKHLYFESKLPTSAFIGLDGAGVMRIVHRALGCKRWRATYRGPGGHSWSAFGMPNPAHAVGLAASRVGELTLTRAHRTTCSVVRLGGGTGLNSIPQQAWLDLDMRSEHPDALRELEGVVERHLNDALDRQNRRRAPDSPALRLELSTLGERPAGETPRDAPLVRGAIAATRAVGREPELAVASTDANVPMSLGIPAVTIGSGGRAGEAHTPREWYENTDGPSGLLRALLVVAAAARV